MTKILGTNMATFIITIPINRLGFLAEILRRYFGNIISGELLEAADRLAKERGALIRKAEYKMDQLKIVMAQLKQATQKLNETKEALDECKARIPGN